MRKLGILTAAVTLGVAMSAFAWGGDKTLEARNLSPGVAQHLYVPAGAPSNATVSCTFEKSGGFTKSSSSLKGTVLVTGFDKPHMLKSGATEFDALLENNAGAGGRMHAITFKPSADFDGKGNIKCVFSAIKAERTGN